MTKPTPLSDLALIGLFALILGVCIGSGDWWLLALGALALIVGVIGLGIVYLVLKHRLSLAAAFKRAAAVVRSTWAAAWQQSRLLFTLLGLGTILLLVANVIRGWVAN